MDANELASRLYNPMNQLCSSSAAAGDDFGALWGCFGVGLLTNLTICFIVYFISEPILLLFFGGFYEKVKQDRPHAAQTLQIEIVALVNATICFNIVFFEAYLLHTIAQTTPTVAFSLPGRSSLWLATGCLIGYMIWHFGMLLYHQEKMKKVLGQNMYYVTFVHHLGSIFFFPVSLRTSLGCYFVSMFVMSEATSVPLAFRTFGLRMGKPFTSSLWFQLANLSWLTVWIVVRIVPMPSMLHTLSQSDWSGLDPISYTLSWLIYVPLVLNTWWSYLIVKGLYKQLCGGGNGKKSKKLK